jgi:hypothetical protein
MQPILSMGMWVSLPTEVRHRVRVAFNIPRSATVDVNDGVVVSDGTTPEDFKALTIEKMQTFLGDTSNDFHKLFDKVVAQVNEELMGKTIAKNLVVMDDKPITVIVEPKRRGRPAKIK